MGYVNIHGKPIDLGGLKTPKKSKTKLVNTPKYEGYRVVGVEPARLAEARAEHAKKSNEPFDDAAWLRNAKLTVIKKGIATPDGANQVRLLAERSGWRKVIVETMAKGK